MIVLDASVVVDLVLNRSPTAQALANRLRKEAPCMLAPHLLDVEVTQVIRRQVLAGALSIVEARAAVVDLCDLPIVRCAHAPLLERALAFRQNITVYDAMYLAIAEAFGAVLLTRDRAMARVPGCTAAVEVLR